MSSKETDDFARAGATYYGGLDGPSPQDGVIFLTERGIQFVWGPKKNRQQVAIPRDQIAGISTDTDRRPSVGAVMAFGVLGLAASQSTASLVVETTDGRVAAFGLHGITSPALIGALARFGLYRQKSAGSS